MVLILLALAFLPLAANAAIWDGTADVSWYIDGETEFIITTAEQLAGLAQLVNSGEDMSDKIIKLGDDIMLNDTTGWQGWADNPPGNEWMAIGGGNFFMGIYPENPKIGRIGVQTTNNTIILENLPPNAKIELYNLQGKRIYSTTSHLKIEVQTKGIYDKNRGADDIEDSGDVMYFSIVSAD